MAGIPRDIMLSNAYRARARTLGFCTAPPALPELRKSLLG